MKCWVALLLICCPFVAASVAAEEDASIDRLLKKLPPPEKLVKRSEPTSADPISRDPLMQNLVRALKAQDEARALTASRQLARKYPQNPLIHVVHGMLAFSGRQMPESSAAFRAALQIDPSISLGYAGLGSAEAAQGRFASALVAFQELTRREPKADVGWIGSSTCAEALGRREQSLQYARRATAVAPRSVGAWLQLARAEDALGHAADARRALAKARQLSGASNKQASNR